VDEGQEPRARLGALGDEAGGRAPGGEKPLLHSVLGEGVVPENPPREAECDPAEPVVELAQRHLVRAGDERDQRFVRQVREIPSHGVRPPGARRG
jgi:hypothetical protein